MNESKIRRLIRLVEESNIESLEVRPFLRTAIRITKSAANNHNGSTPQLVHVPATAPAPAPPAETPPEVPSHYVEITAPMVGTFYQSPSPDAPPFVDVGQMVKPGDVLCIVEAMKLMNEIDAEQAGRIVEIKVENAHPVEFGQVLFILDPTAS